MSVVKVIESTGGTTAVAGSASLPTIENVSSQINGTNTNFTIDNEFRDTSTQVYYNGVLQIRNEDYTEDSDSLGITFQLAPEVDSKVIVIYYQA